MNWITNQNSYQSTRERKRINNFQRCLYVLIFKKNSYEFFNCIFNQSYSLLLIYCWFFKVLLPPTNLEKTYYLTNQPKLLWSPLLLLIILNTPLNINNINNLIITKINQHHHETKPLTTYFLDVVLYTKSSHNRRYSPISILCRFP